MFHFDARGSVALRWPCSIRMAMTTGVAIIALLASSALGAAVAAEPEARPNVVLIMTDDQGYGDLGVHGNPIIKTPVLDRLAGESVEVESFYVCPVCAPTRASLMTGRYNYRTGVTDTWLGRAMMHGDETTIAEVLREAGYRTGIFGKWHLGDSYPMRPMDQGFEESLVHTGGGLCQPSGPPDNTYFNPSLLYNGERIATEGYCSDVYVDYLLDFMKQHRDDPLFIYLPFNCPHGPYQVSDEYKQPYDDLNMEADDFPQPGHGRPSVPGNTSAVFGMVENVDENVGRVLDALDELDLSENTIVIFMTDNGPNGMRYNAGMKMCKGSVYEGGIRTAFYVRWPARLAAGRKVGQMAAHIDLMPTLLEACGVAAPEDVQFDGRSLLPLLEGKPVDWPGRTLFFQWHRGDAPVQYRKFAARSDRFKLVQPSDKTAEGADADQVKFELYDMQTDPLEMKDIAAEKPEVVAELRRQYEAWLADVGRDHGYEAPRILVGTDAEPLTVLTRQDWRGPQANWNPKGLGYWELAVPEGGKYRVTVDFDRPSQAAEVKLRIQNSQHEVVLAGGENPGKEATAPYPLPENGTRVVFSDVELEASPASEKTTRVPFSGKG